MRVHAAEPMLGQQIGEVEIRTHGPGNCEGEWCCIHNPSDHRLKDAPMNFRFDRGIVERLCPHGIGHPDPDDAAFRARRGDENTTHGCDGCCFMEAPC